MQKDAPFQADLSLDRAVPDACASVNGDPLGSSIDLTPARWIWFPSQRTLPNTFALFRREIDLPVFPTRMCGWITADSRYRLFVNGQRVRWGPAPSDPRWQDVDAVDLTPYLLPGSNVSGVEVLYYGHGDGTCPMGKPGLICRFDATFDDGSINRLVSDSRWQTCVDRAHPPGQHKRWYLRALQEVFDARKHPHGWAEPGFAPGGDWLPAMELEGRADRPSMATGYPDYLYDTKLDETSGPRLRARQIPPMQEISIAAEALVACSRVTWLRDPEDWFQFRTPGSFEIAATPIPEPRADGSWELPVAADVRTGVTATFVLKEQMVGWPYFVADAPEGTVIEVMCQEGHDPAESLWLDTHHYSWSRYICHEGVNAFETFDFESLRWIQLHVRGADRPVVIREVGVRRRTYSWPHTPRIVCSDRSAPRSGGRFSITASDLSLTAGITTWSPGISKPFGSPIRAW